MKRLEITHVSVEPVQYQGQRRSILEYMLASRARVPIDRRLTELKLMEMEILISIKKLIKCNKIHCFIFLVFLYSCNLVITNRDAQFWNISYMSGLLKATNVVD